MQTAVAKARISEGGTKGTISRISILKTHIYPKLEIQLNKIPLTTLTVGQMLPTYSSLNSPTQTLKVAHLCMCTHSLTAESNVVQHGKPEIPSHNCHQFTDDLDKSFHLT